MQEEISNRSVTLIFQAGKFTGRVLLQAIQKYLNEVKQQKKTNERKESPAYRGRMKIKDLMKERIGLSNIEVHDEHIRAFERIARRYKIEYAIKKEKGEKPNYLVFFRAKDSDMLQVAFNEFVRNRLKIQDKPSLIQKLQQIVGLPYILDKVSKNKRIGGNGLP